MSDIQGYAPSPIAIGYDTAEARFEYMKRTYGLLLAGIGAFVAMEVFLFVTGIAYSISEFVFGTSWLLILGGFMLLSWMANTMAFRAKTRQQALGGYALLVLAQALIFTPMLALAFEYAPGAISSAAAVSVVGFVGLSGVAITSSKDFSFLGSVLKWVGIGVLLLIVGSVIFGASLGTWFSVGMIVFAGAGILWDTQRIMKTYPAGTEIQAAMQLFSSAALLFWYVLRLFMSRD